MVQETMSSWCIAEPQDTNFTYLIFSPHLDTLHEIMWTLEFDDWMFLGYESREQDCINRQGVCSSWTKSNIHNWLTKWTHDREAIKCKWRAQENSIQRRPTLTKNRVWPLFWKPMYCFKDKTSLPTIIAGKIKPKQWNPNGRNDLVLDRDND